LRILGFLFIMISTIFVCGCARGLVKEGPTGESGKGIGLKIPVLNFGKKDAYDAENLSPGNLKEEELNPFQQSEDRSPADPLAIEGR
ncbi:MAG: hypothetical protein KC917_23915, partial [Candidatus Omnitrophica bacterium]|nr:hypothetical protein [Candidatus Omnitrophota bacterium]